VFDDNITKASDNNTKLKTTTCLDAMQEQEHMLVEICKQTN
jgi:hypothetical protein